MEVIKLNTLRFTIGFILSEMRSQILKFEKRARYPFRFIVLAFLTLGVSSVYSLFKKLPEDIVDILIANLNSVEGTLATIYLTAVGLFGLYLGLLVKKVAKTL